MYTWEKWDKMTTQAERISVLETKVDDLRLDVKDMHDCLDKTRDLLSDKLKEISELDQASHAKMLDKISSLEQFKTKWVYLSAGAIAALGWITAHAETITKLLN